MFITLLGRWTLGGEHYGGLKDGGGECRNPAVALNPRAEIREGSLEEEVISKPIPEESMGEGRMRQGVPGKDPEPRKNSFKRIISIKDVKIQI